MSEVMERTEFPSTYMELARLLGVSKSCVYNWKKKGLGEIRHDDGRFDPGEVQAWVETKKKEKLAKSRPSMDMRHNNQHDLKREKVEAGKKDPVGLDHEPLDIEDERDWSNLYRKMKALKETIVVRQLQGEVVNRREVEEMFADRARSVKQTIMSLGRRLAPRLVGMNAREIETEITKETRKICQDYSRPIQKK